MADRKTRVDEITRIYKRDGKVTASGVVKAATPKKSPLHNEFDWDDKSAAYKHRLATARRIIRVTPVRMETGVEQRLIHVPTVTPDGPTASFVEREGKYQPMAVVKESPKDFEAALNELQSQVRAIQRTIAALKKSAGSELQLMSQLENAMSIARDTIQVMLNA